MRKLIVKKATATPMDIYLIEDDDGDAKALKRTFSKAGICNRVTRFRDGIEAIEFLQSREDFNPHNALVLCDINMPRMNGLELLEAVRRDSDLWPLPFVMLTTSNDTRDIEAAQTHNVIGYVLKSAGAVLHEKLLEKLERYWEVNALPTVGAEHVE